MGGKTDKITLGGIDYVVRQFSIGELRRIARLVQASDSERFELPFKILEIAMERAQPKPPEGGLDAIEADPDEIEAAGITIMKLAGIKTVAVGADGLPLPPPAKPPGP